MTETETKVVSPHTDRHYMTIKPAQGKVEIVINNKTLASTAKALVVTEFARQPYDPVIYLERSEIHMDALTKNDKTSVCPLKGEAVFFDFEGLASVAWSYERPVEAAFILKDLIAFYPQNVKISPI